MKLDPLHILGIASMLAASSVSLPAAFVTGRVQDAATQTYLADVKISVQNDTAFAFSDRGGFFRIEVPGGPQVLVFNFVGLPETTYTVELRSDETKYIEVLLGEDTVQLEKMVITGQSFGQALALNSQRNSENIKNVVSADAIGRFPDQNAAEALNRLPGISVERDQGEGRFVVIRGIDPNLNSAAIDGVALASPSTDSRATLLDTIPADTLQSLEVSKTVLPSEPGDAIGGYINIKTPSAYDREGLTARFLAQTNYSDLTNDWKYKVAAAAGDTFGSDKQYGLMVNASYEERDFGSDNQEADPWSKKAQSWINEDELQFREYNLTRTRLGVSGNFEFRPHSDHNYFLRSSFNEYEDTETRQIAAFLLGEEYENADGDDEDLTEFDAITTDSYTAKNVAIERAFKDRTETMTIWVASTGGKHVLGDWQLDYTASYSMAKEDTPDDNEFFYTLFNDKFAEIDTNPDFKITNIRGYHPQVNYIANSGLDPYNPANYKFDGVESAQQIAEEEQYAFQTNARFDFDWAEVSYLKFGGLFRNKDKTNDLEEYENDKEPAEIKDFAKFRWNDPRDAYQVRIPYTDPRITGYFFDNKSAFDLERDDEASVIEDYDSNEKVFAGYFMMGLGSQSLNVIFGSRLEHTEYETNGARFDNGNVTAVDFKKTYTNVLPGVHLKYQLSPDLLLRAAWSRTIARPTFEQARPGQLIDGKEVEAGNPALDPYKSWNYDLSLDYYLPGLGLLSGAFFYKEIDNFIYEQTILNGININGLKDITTFRNGESGKIIGAEFAYQQQFDFLPAPFDGLGIYANITLSDSESTVLGEKSNMANRELPFFKHSDRVANFALTYEKYGFFFRIAASTRSEYLDEVGGSPDEDRYVDEHFQVDVSSSYEIVHGITVFANFLNITNEPFRAYYGESNGLSQFEEYGWSGTFGVRWQY